MSKGGIMSLEMLIAGRPMWSDTDVSAGNEFSLKISTVEGFITIRAKTETDIKKMEVLKLVELVDRVETHPATSRQEHIRYAIVRASDDNSNDWR